MPPTVKRTPPTVTSPSCSPKARDGTPQTAPNTTQIDKIKWRFYKPVALEDVRDAGKSLFQHDDQNLDPGDPVNGQDDIDDDEAELRDPEEYMDPELMQKHASEDSTLEDAIWASEAKKEELVADVKARTRRVYTHVCMPQCVR